ncbi:MAG: hypothetical protein A2X08_17265 [Bacteroidetes bacterium GWA2_32_17]|nr:MAG: hypothetical protein A2X08_17265 [Bacteroidetes bacterium GWA2_32_17]
MITNNIIDKDSIKLMLSRLDKSAFTKFIFELFGQSDFDKDYEHQKTYYLKKFGENIIEQNYIDRKEQHSQGYKLIIPFFEPFDLFKNIENSNVGFNEMKQLFKYYKRITNNRYAGWRFWVDGNYNMPDIKFVTNYSGFDENIYQDILFPKFENFVEQFELDSRIMIGSLDSFFSLNPEGTCNAFNRFMKKYENEISISIIDDQYKVQGHYCEKYFNNGVLKNSLLPCEPLVSFNLIDESQVIAEFEFLLNNHSKENELEAFLKKYYKNLFGSDYDRIETQLWLKFPDLDINRKNRRLDIFLRNSVARDWELFELKRAINIIKNKKDIPSFTSAFTTALQQIRDYDRILGQDLVKRTLAKDGIEYYNPELRLVIGRTPDISIEKWRWLKKSNERELKIITYDELFDGMKSRSLFHNNFNIFNI